jgi:hypothetical protein
VNLGTKRTRWSEAGVTRQRQAYDRCGSARDAIRDELLKSSPRATASTEDRSLQIAASPATRLLPAPAPHELGLVFKRMRRARQVTRAQLAQKVGLAAAYIARSRTAGSDRRARHSLSW